MSGSEDVELGYRWTRAGYQVIYNPRAWGEHYHPHDLDTACRLQEVIGRGLRDLEALIPDPGLLERYGVFSWDNSPRSVAVTLNAVPTRSVVGSGANAIDCAAFAMTSVPVALPP